MPGKKLDATTLARPAAVVRHRSDVSDEVDLEARGVERAQRRLAAGARAVDVDRDVADAVLHRLLRGVLGGELRGERRRLARALEAAGTGRRPRDDVAADVGDRDDRVVERRRDVGDAGLDVLPDLLLLLAFDGGHGSFSPGASEGGTLLLGCLL